MYPKDEFFLWTVVVYLYEYNYTRISDFLHLFIS